MGVFEQLLLLTIFPGLFLSQDVTVGFTTSGRIVLSEDSTTSSLCANVISSSISTYSINVATAYQDRGAIGGNDFVATPYSFTFTPTQTQYCFNVTLIDDEAYEVREEFIVNITSDNPGVLLAPHFTVIVVDDNDYVTIGWEKESYTIAEENSHLDVYVRLMGFLETILPQVPITVEAGSAIEGQDFTFCCQFVNFPKGSNSSSLLRFTVDILKDIEYEGDKRFDLIIGQINAQRVTTKPQRTTVDITDYNVITHLQPSTSCEGIENLIQSSGPCNVMTLDSLCNAAFCSTTDWSVMLLFQACDKQGMLNLTDKSNGASAKVSFGSDPQVQELNHTLGNVSDTASLSTRIVSSAQMFYYLVSLDAPLFNISFRMTAIPLQCPHNTGQSASSNRTSSSNRTASSNRTGLTVVLVMFAVILFMVIIGYFCLPQGLRKKRNSKEIGLQLLKYRGILQVSSSYLVAKAIPTRWLNNTVWPEAIESNSHVDNISTETGIFAKQNPNTSGKPFNIPSNELRGHRDNGLGNEDSIKTQSQVKFNDLAPTHNKSKHAHVPSNQTSSLQSTSYMWVNTCLRPTEQQDTASHLNAEKSY